MAQTAAAPYSPRPTWLGALSQAAHHCVRLQTPHHSQDLMLGENLGPPLRTPLLCASSHADILSHVIRKRSFTCSQFHQVEVVMYFY